MTSKSRKILVSVLGASGYTGAELIRLLITHPYVEIDSLTAERHSGRYIGDVFPHFNRLKLPILKKIQEINFKNVDLVFSCLPSGHLNKIVKQIPEKSQIIDLSPDFRFKDVAIYEKWYGKHNSANLLNKVSYGLSELNRKYISRSRIVSCPGCYPTSILLALLPLLKKNIIKLGNIIIDSKSGTTGAGRSLNPDLLFSEVDESIRAYGVTGHRHKPEIEEKMAILLKKKIKVVFTPHLVPMKRGILSTIYLMGDETKIIKELKNIYKNELFIDVLDLNTMPSTSEVIGSNKCIMGVSRAKGSKYTVIVSVIDNLLKGASGQAVQNMNIMFKYKEDLGLAQQPFYP